jgi:hypothetical protein
MGLDVNEILGIPKADDYNSDNDYEEDKLVTRKELENYCSEVSKPKAQSATELALGIDNEAERELHLHYLENVIKPSGDAQQDFQMAKTMVDAIKLKNNAALSSLKPEVKNTSSASSYMPNKSPNQSGTQLTREEDMLYRDAKLRGITLTKEEIINMRAR